MRAARIKPEPGGAAHAGDERNKKHFKSGLPGGYAFADVVSLALSLLALRLACRLPTETRTYGLHRAEIFAALLNGLTLLVMAVLIGREAWHRFWQPPEIKTTQMLVVAVVGLLANWLVLTRLSGHHHDLNVRSAYLHVLGDMLASVGVVIAALVMFAVYILYDTSNAGYRIQAQVADANDELRFALSRLEADISRAGDNATWNGLAGGDPAVCYTSPAIARPLLRVAVRPATGMAVTPDGTTAVGPLAAGERPALPLPEGSAFEITLPPPFYRDDYPSFTLQWIDFYR